MIVRSMRTMAADPVGVILAVPKELQKVLQWRRADDSRLRSQVDEIWDEHLHYLLGTPWPCSEAGRLDPILADIAARLAARGLGSGRSTYCWYSNADSCCATRCGA